MDGEWQDLAGLAVFSTRLVESTVKKKGGCMSALKVERTRLQGNNQNGYIEPGDWTSHRLHRMGGGGFSSTHPHIAHQVSFRPNWCVSHPHKNPPCARPV